MPRPADAPETACPPAIIEQRPDPSGWTVRWNPQQAARAVAEGLWPGVTVADLAAQRMAAEPERILIIDGDRRLTVRELFESAQRLAGYFVGAGLQVGEVISFQLPNWWEASVINLAAAMTGLVVNPIVPINRDGELRHMLPNARAKMMFVPEVFRGFDYAKMLRRVAPTLSPAPKVVVVRGAPGEFLAFDDLLRCADPLTTPRKVDADSVKLVMYTSGTTGRPKAVLHSHNTIHSDGLRMCAAMGLNERDVSFSASPVTHVTGFLWVLNLPWLAGITSVAVDVWEPWDSFRKLAEHRCSVMVGATPFLQGVTQIVEETGETLPDLRHYICGGAAVPPKLIYDAARLLPNCIPWRTFGSTETTTLTRGPATRDDIRLGAETDGLPWGVEVRVVDLVTGVDKAEGDEGELLARSPGLMLGYADPADNLAAFDAQGYFRMGDLVRLVDGGHILCTGRAKDLIIRGGENISAKEIEDVLALSPKIEEAAVVSMPSPRTGEAICAFLVMRAGARIDLPEVDALVREAGLARQKTPEHLELVDELPKTAAGKVRKDLLRDAAAQIAATRGVGG